MPLPGSPGAARHAATVEPAWVRWLLIGVAGAFLAVFLPVPLAAVFAEALRKGAQTYFAALGEPDALAAIRLTLLAAAIAVPLNLAFGVAAAWAIAKFDFRGKSLLITLIDLPFAVSPVIAGLDPPEHLPARGTEHARGLLLLLAALRLHQRDQLARDEGEGDEERRQHDAGHGEDDAHLVRLQPGPEPALRAEHQHVDQDPRGGDPRRPRARTRPQAGRGAAGAAQAHAGIPRGGYSGGRSTVGALMPALAGRSHGRASPARQVRSSGGVTARFAPPFQSRGGSPMLPLFCLLP
jgi:hypothetical protein